MRISSLLLMLSSVLAFHTSQAAETIEPDKYQRPEGIPSPSSNPLTAEKAALGKTLFFDTRLSRNGDMSCATCHQPDKRWRDDRMTPLGAEDITHARRTPTVLNSAWLTALMWDGRATSLEAQAELPITTAHEMNYEMTALIERLKDVEGYRKRFSQAFSDEVITAERVTQALASFQRTLVSSQAPFDRWVSGDKTAISENAKRGFEIFNGKAQCAACHKSWRFTDDSFHDIGLPTDDLGRGELVPKEVIIMQHAFKTPSLRDLSLDGPYMHDGSMNSLEEVINHYEDGGVQRDSLSPEMKPFELSDDEKTQLVEFLKTLVAPPLEVEPPSLPE